MQQNVKQDNKAGNSSEPRLATREIAMKPFMQYDTDGAVPEAPERKTAKPFAKSPPCARIAHVRWTSTTILRNSLASSSIYMTDF